MKKITQAIFLAMIAYSFSLSAQEKNNGHSKDKMVFGKAVSPNKISSSGHIRCATDEYEDYLKSINPSRETKEQFEILIEKAMKNQNLIHENASQSGGIVYIPVVVHVIHNGDAYGVDENITDEQVQSQITVMNQDFRKMLGTPGYNTNPIGADIQVEFVLAKSDPNGNPTNGINRINMCEDFWEMDSIDAIVKPTTIWNPTLYMNMWSVNFGGADAGILGYAQFPSSGTATANTDGVVAGYGYFGSSALATGSFSPPYDRGRTMTHEVGHFLGLYHTFQGGCAGENNTSGDYCADTPAVLQPNYGCTPINSCPTGGNDMIANYMDYTDDTCMNIFTTEQKARIDAVMNTFPRRLDLKTSTKDLPIALFANDAEVIIDNVCSASSSATCANPNPTAPLKKVMLYNRGTSTLTSATLSYNINGGTNYVHNWSGSLAANKYAEITLANTAVNGILNVSITAVNGGADQRASNNSASKNFTSSSSSVPYFNYTTFAFTLVGDRYGTETSWNLKNAAGTTLYSGGPYTNLGASGTQTLVNNQAWNLPANGCYYLTVNDSYGDGIVGGYGNGYFTVTANGGAVSVVNNTTFTGSTTVHYFTNNATLTTDNFELNDEVSVYPNPASNELNIKFASGFAGAFNYTIVNSIGQVVKTAAVTSQEGLKINTSGYSNGVYFIKIEKDGKTKTIKFLKN